jgi:hypothetical protein
MKGILVLHLKSSQYLIMAAFPLVQLRSLRHASTQEDGQTIRRKQQPAAGKRQIHARISRSESGRHALPCVYPLRTHFAHACPLAYCYPYACNQRMCHIACVVAQVKTQPKPHAVKTCGALHLHPKVYLITTRAGGE